MTAFAVAKFAFISVALPLLPKHQMFLGCHHLRIAFAAQQARITHGNLGRVLWSGVKAKACDLL